VLVVAGHGEPPLAQVCSLAPVVAYLCLINLRLLFRVPIPLALHYITAIQIYQIPPRLSRGQLFFLYLYTTISSKVNMEIPALSTHFSPFTHREESICTTVCISAIYKKAFPKNPMKTLYHHHCSKLSICRAAIQRFRRSLLVAVAPCRDDPG